MHNLVEQFRDRFNYIPAIKYEGVGERDHPNQLSINYSDPSLFVEPACYSSESQDEAIQGYRSNYHKMVTAPGSDSYIPPLIPFSVLSQFNDKTGKIARTLRASALGLVGDIWTQLLVDKVDQEQRTAERPCHLLWDSQIPKVNALTSLFWLLTCETWPLPANIDSGDWDSGYDSQREPADLFPSQAFVLPASMNKIISTRQVDSLVYGGRPKVVNEGSSWLQLSTIMSGHLTRADREKMPKYQFDTINQPSYRPQPQEHSILKLRPHSSAPGRSWSANDGFNVTMFRQIGGYCYTQTPDSHFNLYALEKLRSTLFGLAGIVTYPGMPSDQTNIYDAPGAWIRNWSEYGLIVATAASHMWTNDDSVIKVGGVKQAMHPTATPPFWFGWTHIGTKTDVVDGKPTMERTPSAEWVDSYMMYRPFALKMLFEPDTIQLDALIDDHVANRTETLRRAGRLKGGASSGEAAKESMAAAIQQSAVKFKLFG